MIGFGRYNLLLRIGRGGMGTVWLGRQKALGRYCAVKLLDPSLAAKPENNDRFVRETRAAASLSHPNIVSVFDGDEFDGQHFIAMEYVEGFGVAEILQLRGPAPVALALRWLEQAAVALDYVHGRGLIHRDVKPHNMLINAENTLKLMDLGLAKDMLDTEHSLTVTGTVVGSPSYISPEQIRNAKTVDARTDLYSLGISFFQMLTGKVPFERSSAAAVCVAHLQEPMPSVRLADPQLTAGLDRLVARLAAKNPAARHQTAAQALAEIRPWLEQYPWDDASRAYLAGVPFTDRTVAHLLKTEGIEMRHVDDNLTPMARGAMATVLQGDGHDATAIMQDTTPVRKRRPWLWLVGGMLLGAALVGGTVFVMWKQVVAPLIAQMKTRAKASPTLADLAAWQKQRRVFAEESFGEARRCSDAEWPGQKKRLLHKVRQNLEQQWRIQDPAMRERIVANSAELLDEVRAMSQTEYQKFKPALVDRWLMQGRKPGDRPPGGKAATR
jgi:hypothetical protein